MIRNAIHGRATMRSATPPTTSASPERGMREKRGEAGEIGWVTFAHDAARPTVAVQNGPDGATYLLDRRSPAIRITICIISFRTSSSPTMAGSARSTRRR